MAVPASVNVGHFKYIAAAASQKLEHLPRELGAEHCCPVGSDGVSAN
jgi:hypothetical protein